MGNKIKTVNTGGGSATPVANDFNNFIRQGLNNGSYGAVGQTQGVGNTINSLLAGGNKAEGGMGSFQDLMSRFSQTPNFQPPSVNAPGFQMPNSISGVNYSLPGGGADLGNIISQIGMRNLLPSINGETPQSPTSVNTSGQQNTPEFDAISKILGNQFTKDLGDIRERYGVSSAGLNAESVYRGQAIPQLSQALSQSALAQRQAGQTDTGLGLQGQGLNLQGALGSMGNMLGQRGQDLNSLLTGRGQDIQTGSLASGQSLAAIQNLLSQRGQDVSQMGLGVDQRGQTLQALLGLSGQGLSASQSNAGNFLSGQGLLNNYMGTYGNLGLGGGQLNLAGQQLGQQGQMGALQQMFQALMQANQIGTPQAQSQSYQQPGTFSQIMSGLGGLGQGLGSMFSALSGAGGLSGLFGGGGLTPNAAMGNIGAMPFGALQKLGMGVA